MNKGTIKTFFKNATTEVGKHSPEILTTIGIIGFTTTIVCAVKATPKAMTLIEEAKEEKGEDLTAYETVKAAWKPFVPVVISGVFSSACIIGATSVNVKRNVALATAYKVTEETLSIYKDKVIETVGEKKAAEVKDKVAEERVKKTPVSNTTEVIITGGGKTLCFDSISSRYFESDMESIRKSINDLNAELISQDYISLNEFYDKIGLTHTKIGDDLGWSVFRDGLVDISFSSTIAEDGRPCLVLDYLVEPKYEFYKYR